MKKKVNKKNKIKNKKGIADILVFVIIVFSIAIGLFVFHFVNKNIHDTLKPELTTEESQTALTEGVTKLNNMLDSLVFIIFIISVALIIITSFLVNVHPVFFVFYLILIPLALILAVILSNTYTEITTQEEFNQTVSSFKMTNFIMNKLPLFTLIVISVSAVIVFGKIAIPGL